MLLSSRKVLVFEDPQGPIYRSLSLSHSLDLKSSVLAWTINFSKIVKDFAFCKQSVMYDHVVHKFGYHHRAVKNGLLTYLSSVSKPFFAVTQCCLSPRKVLVLKDITGSRSFEVKVGK